MKYSFITATYNRAHKLVDLIEHMNNISYDSFEWIVVDDGSSDGTSEVFTSAVLDSRIDFKYFKQENSGKHVALNTAIDKSNGEWLIVLDSDDYYIPECLIELDLITSKISPAIAGITTLTMDTKGIITGDKFPEDYQEDYFFNLMSENNIKGDKTFIYKAAILKLFKFPVFENENFLPESIVINRISLNYKNAFVNIPLEIIDYQPDGLSAKMKIISKKNPLGTSLRYQELLVQKIKFSDRIKFKYLAFKYANLVKTDSEFINQSPSYEKMIFRLLLFLNKLK